jgi:beta-phosphoglucomutase family hydrolase
MTMVSALPLPHPERHALVFDLDGTLIESMPWHVRAWTQLLEENGISIDKERFIRETSGKTNAQILGELFGHTLTDDDAARLAARKEAIYRALYEPHVRPLPGTVALLSAARRLGLRMALATAAPMPNVVFVLERTRLGVYFDAIVCADDGLPGKPAPDMFLMAARRLATEPRKAIVFEDALNGLAAAERAGMRAVAVTTTLSPEEIGNRPGVIAVVRDFTALDLEALLASEGRVLGAAAG